MNRTPIRRSVYQDTPPSQIFRRDLLYRRERKQYPYRSPIKKRQEGAKGMTVCVAALCDKGKTIITASDTMITINEQVTDDAVLKLTSISNWWTAMVAGDINHCEMIIRRAQLPNRDDMATAEEVRDRILEAYEHEANIEVVGQELSGFCISDAKTFWDEGLEKMGSKMFEDTKYRIDSLKRDLQWDLLVFGFDKDGQGHIMTFHAPGIVKIHTQPGYAAIGIGADAARYQLGYRGQSPRATRAATLSRICEAKFRSENMSGVGKSTKAYTLCCRGEKAPYGRASAFLPENVVDQIRAIWISQSYEVVPEIADWVNEYFEPRDP